MRTYRCKKQQDTFSHLYLHHHALCNDQCFSDRIFQKHQEWISSGSGSSDPDPYFASGICPDHWQTAEIKRGGKRIHHLFQFRKPGDPTCDSSSWRRMGDLCQCILKRTDDPDVDARAVSDGGESRRQLEKNPLQHQSDRDHPWNCPVFLHRSGFR